MSTTITSRARVRSRVAAAAVLALLAAGLPSSATAADSTTISGTIVLPAGVAPGEMYADTYRYDEVDQEWELGKYTEVYASGPFEIDGLEPGREYRVALYIRAEGYVGGFYVGGGPLVANPEQGITMYAGATDVVLAPVKGVDLKGTLSVPAGFDWNAGPVEINAYELEADGTDFRESHWVEVTEEGAFSIPGTRPGGVFAIFVEDGGSRFPRGYYHAGAGLVSSIEHGTPVTTSSNPHVVIGTTLSVAALTNVDAPRVTGKVVVGEKVTATSGTWSLLAPTLTYQWLRNGAAIAGATGTSYSIVPADADAKLAVRVSAAKAPFAPAAATSAASTVAKGAAAKATKSPAVKGTARLGKTLKAASGSWDTAGVALSYQWLRGGKAIKGARSAKYRVTTADVGKRVSVRVTAKRAGYADGVAASAAKKVAKGKPKVTAKLSASKVVVKVKAAGLKKLTGTVTVKVGSTSVKAKLVAKAKGKVTVALPSLSKGKHSVKVSFKPTKKAKKYVTKASSKKYTLRIK